MSVNEKVGSDLPYLIDFHPTGNILFVGDLITCKKIISNTWHFYNIDKQNP